MGWGCLIKHALQQNPFGIMDRFIVENLHTHDGTTWECDPSIETKFMCFIYTLYGSFIYYFKYFSFKKITVYVP